MKTYELDNMPRRLQTLVEEAQAGEEILITEHRRPVAKLVPVLSAIRLRPKAGSLPGKVWMATDFNAPLADFEEYMK